MERRAAQIPGAVRPQRERPGTGAGQERPRTVAAGQTYLRPDVKTRPGADTAAHSGGGGRRGGADRAALATHPAAPSLNRLAGMALLFKKKTDPISDRARALNEEIAALEAQ